ncbi:MAG: glycosyltransferase family 4 protein [Candidatus Microgenomates bacterium]|jgi:glycosyltransferase involved in cell wall biosynthesis
MNLTVNSKNRILIAYQYLSFKGGIEEVIINQAKELKKLGYPVRILTSTYSKTDLDRIEDNIEIVRIPSINIAYKIFGIPFAVPILTPHNVMKIYNEIANSDVINIHGHPYLASFVYVYIAKRLKKHIVLTQHNTEIFSNSIFVNLIYKLFDKTLGKYNLDNSTDVIAGSKATKKYIQKITNNKNIKVIYNGVDNERFYTKYSKSFLRKKLNIPINKFVCLTIRRITFKNGIDNLSKAAELSKNSHVLFLIGGTGPDLKSTKKYIQKRGFKNVKLVGYISDNNLPLYYSAADVFILPSRKGEGFPMAILEAMSAGLPVIATKSGGHTEIIKNGKTGFQVETQNPKQINLYIDTLFNNKELQNRISKNCRDVMIRKFTWEKNIDSLLKVINKV